MTRARAASLRSPVRFLQAPLSLAAALLFTSGASVEGGWWAVLWWGLTAVFLRLTWRVLRARVVVTNQDLTIHGVLRRWSLKRDEGCSVRVSPPDYRLLMTAWLPEVVRLDGETLELEPLRRLCAPWKGGSRAARDDAIAIAEVLDRPFYDE